MDDHKKSKDKNDQKSNKNYIYFMTSYPSDSQNFKTSLKEVEASPEPFYEKNVKNKFELTVKVFRFEIIEKNVSEKVEMTVVMEETDVNKTKYEYSFKLSDLNKSFFEYDVKIQKIDVLPLKKKEQFNIFLEALNKLKDGEKDKEKMDLFLCTQKLLSNELKEKTEENDVQIDSDFYFSLFLESCKTQDTKLIHDIILLFDPTKIKDIKNIPKEMVEKLKDELEKLEKNFKKSEPEEKTLEVFYNLLLCFNFYFYKDKALHMFNDETIFKYLFVNLENFPDFIGKLILEKEIVEKLIEKAKSYKQILNFLYFAKRNLKDFLEVLFEKIDKIKEKKNKNEKIDLWQYIEPKIGDEEILYICENKNTFDEVVDINRFFSTYVDKSKQLGFNLKLETLIKLEENCKSNSLKNKVIDELKISINLKISNLTKEGKLKNKEVLDALEKSSLFFESDKKKNEIFLELLNGIDIDLLKKNENDKKAFFEKWKKMKLDQIYYEAFNYKFINKILSLIKKTEDFHFLNDFFYEIKKNIIGFKQEKYINLIRKKPEDFYNYIELVVDLIKNSNDDRDFLKKI